MGATAVELCGRNTIPVSELSDTGVRSLRKILDDLNLRVAAIRFQTRHGYDHLPDLDRRVDATKNAMRAAYRLGAPVVVNQIGEVPPGPATTTRVADLDAADTTTSGHGLLRLQPSRTGPTASAEPVDPRWSTMQAVLEDLGRFGAKIGALLAAETGTESGPRLAALLQASDEAFVAAALNPGQLIINRHSVPDAVDALGDRIALVCAVDGVLDLSAGRGLTVPLGQGIADFPNLIGKLEDIPYRGVFTVGRPSMEPETAVDELRRSAEYLSNL